MNSQALAAFWKLYHALPSSIQQQADDAFSQFERDPFHPSLHFKKVNKKRGVWSARINQDYWALGFRTDTGMIWFWIGSHTEYDKIIARF